MECQWSEPGWHWIVAITLLFILIAYVASLFRIYRKTTYQLNTLKTKLNSYYDHLNPEFILNCLSAIKHHILTNNPTLAARHLTQFSQLVQYFLENIDKQAISLKKVLDTLILYLGLERLRFSNRFDFEVLVDDDIQPSSYLVSPFLLHLYVEDAIWFGLMHSPSPRNLWIRVQAATNKLTFTIEDNGTSPRKQRRILSPDKNGPSQYSFVENFPAAISSEKITVTISELVGSRGQTRGTQLTLEIQLDDRGCHSAESPHQAKLTHDPI